MKFPSKALLATGLTCLVAGSSAPPLQASGDPTCAHVRHINNFRHVDATTAIFEAGPGRKYKITFKAQCRDLKWAFAVRVEAGPGACLKPGDAIVVSRDGVIPERCFVKSVEALPAS